MCSKRWFQLKRRILYVTSQYTLMKLFTLSRRNSLFKLTFEKSEILSFNPLFPPCSLNSITRIWEEEKKGYVKLESLHTSIPKTFGLAQQFSISNFYVLSQKKIKKTNSLLYVRGQWHKPPERDYAVHTYWTDTDSWTRVHLRHTPVVWRPSCPRHERVPCFFGLYPFFPSPFPCKII